MSVGKICGIGGWGKFWNGSMQFKENYEMGGKEMAFALFSSGLSILAGVRIATSRHEVEWF